MKSIEAASGHSRRRGSRWLRHAALTLGGATSGFALLGAGLAWGFLHPARTVGQGTPADQGLEYEPVSLATPDGVSLQAWYVPRRGAQAGVVVCHGYRSCRQHLRWLLPVLHRAGFAALSFDFRGMGESGGFRCTFGHREQEDVRAAIHYLEQRAGIEAGQIGVWGHSMGGAAAILAAAEDPGIGAVVTDATFSRLDQMVRQRLSRLGLISAPLADCTQWWAERITGFPASAVSPAAVISRIAPRPVLIIHGEADTHTPSAHARALYESAAEPKQLWLIQEGTHVGCRDVDPAEYEQRVTGFFREALVARGSRDAVP